MKRTIVKIVSKKFIPALIFTAAILACAPTQTKANAKNIEIISNENAKMAFYKKDARTDRCNRRTHRSAL